MKTRTLAALLLALVACSSNENFTPPPENDNGSAPDEDGTHGDDPPDASSQPAPPAVDDAGSAITPDAGAAEAGPPKMNQPLLKSGLHPDASDALRSIGVGEERVGQTIGYAQASAKTHEPDGVANGKEYSAATDLRILDLNETQIKKLLDDLGRVGFIAWYRKPGADGWPSTEAKHIHAVWTACAMKESLRLQVRDWLVGKNGLKYHEPYRFYAWPAASIDFARGQYVKFNPLT